jgi:hypothetical protein
MKLFSSKIKTVPTNADVIMGYTVHTIFLGVFDLGPLMMPNGDPFVFPTLIDAQKFIK